MPTGRCATCSSPLSYDEFCVTVPDNPFFDNPGQQQCGYYDVTPALFGVVTRHFSDSKKFGDQRRYWDGFAFSFDGRFPNGATLAGGLDVGRQVDDHCFTVDEPNQPRGLNGNRLAGGPSCRLVTSWNNLTDFRIRGSYPLPADFTFSWIYKNTPGASIDADLQVVPADVTFVDPAREALNMGGTGPGRLTGSGKLVELIAPNRDSRIDSRSSTCGSRGASISVGSAPTPASTYTTR